MKLGKDLRTMMEGHLHHIQKIPKCWKLTILVKRSLCAFLDAEMTRLGWSSDARFCNDREDMLCFLLIKTVECFQLIICRMLSCSNEMKILAPFSILGGVMSKIKSSHSGTQSKFTNWKGNKNRGYFGPHKKWWRQNSEIEIQNVTTSEISVLVTLMLYIFVPRDLHYRVAVRKSTSSDLYNCDLIRQS